MTRNNDCANQFRNLLFALTILLAAAHAQSPASAASPVTNSDSLMRAGYQQICQGDNETAVDTLSAAVRSNPASVEARRYLGYALMHKGLAVQAVPQLEYVSKMAPATASDRALLGDAYFYAGQYQKALDSYQQALKLDANHDAARAGLVHTYVAVGDTTNAAQICQQGVQKARTLASRNRYESLMRNVQPDPNIQVMSE